MDWETRKGPEKFVKKLQCNKHLNVKLKLSCIVCIHTHSPPANGGTHTPEGETKTDATTATNTGFEKVLYAAPVQTVTVPHQTSAGGELYAMSTKAVNKKNKDQSPQEHFNKDDTKEDIQGVSSSISCCVSWF